MYFFWCVIFIFSHSRWSHQTIQGSHLIRSRIAFRTRIGLPGVTCFFRHFQSENTLKHGEPIPLGRYPTPEGRLYGQPNYLAQLANTQAAEWLHAYLSAHPLILRYNRPAGNAMTHARRSGRAQIDRNTRPSAHRCGYASVKCLRQATELNMHMALMHQRKYRRKSAFVPRRRGFFFIYHA